jgi:hypothetical protein
MALHTTWQQWLGDWRGTNRLMLPGSDDRICDTTLRIATAGKGSLLTLVYDWSFQGEPATGQLWVSQIPGSEKVEAVFWDTWHLADKFMHMKGRVADDGDTLVDGTYEVPDNPDWGWRIVLKRDGADKLIFQMINVEPNGQAEPGVEILVSRTG